MKLLCNVLSFQASRKGWVFCVLDQPGGKLAVGYLPCGPGLVDAAKSMQYPSVMELEYAPGERGEGVVLGILKASARPGMLNISSAEEVGAF